MLSLMPSLGLFKRKLALKKLAWENCGNEEDPGRLYSLNIKHTPLGDVTASLKFGSTVQVTRPIKVQQQQ